MRLFLFIVCLAAAADARAQGLPSEPISVANGRFVFGGEVFASYGGADPGWFNYTDYEYNGLRNFRAALSTEVRVSWRFQVLAELRLDHGEHLSAYAMFLRVRPWPDRRFDLQVGRVPPTFGAFSKTVYAYNNLVIGQPLAYQYLLSIRPDAVPSEPADLFRMRARGWLSDFPLGDRASSPGVPVVNTSRFDTGVQVHGVSGPVEWTGAVTAGSLSDPQIGGGRVTFVNGHNRAHDMSSDPHPSHEECPEINQVGFLQPGQSGTTGNMTTLRTCGFHDHNAPGDTGLQGRITIVAAQ